jgi:hypothetical protein
VLVLLQEAIQEEGFRAERAIPLLKARLLMNNPNQFQAVRSPHHTEPDCCMQALIHTSCV